MIELLKDAYWAVYCFFRWEVAYFPREVKWHWQRAFRGWADCDVWSMDRYLSPVIEGMMRELAENGISYGGYFTPESWKAMLLEIADALKGARDVEDWDYPVGRPKEETAAFYDRVNAAYERQKKALYLMADNFQSLWD